MLFMCKEMTGWICACKSGRWCIILLNKIKITTIFRCARAPLCLRVYVCVSLNIQVIAEYSFQSFLFRCNILLQYILTDTNIRTKTNTLCHTMIHGEICEETNISQISCRGNINKQVSSTVVKSKYDTR